MKMLLRWIITAATLLLATNLVMGFEVRNFYIALIAALVLGLLNAIVRPVLLLLTLPVNILTLGLFTFVINGLLIWFMSSFVKGVEVAGFLPALCVALILWAVGILTNWLLYTGKE
jgi:putative membrane protein